MVAWQNIVHQFSQLDVEKIDNTLQKVKGETRLAKKRKGHHFQHKEAPKAAPAAEPANTRLLGKR